MRDKPKLTLFKKWKKAINTLIKFYEPQARDFPGRLYNCPLCIVHQEEVRLIVKKLGFEPKYIKEGNCICPWKIYSRRWCVNYFREQNRDQRIKRLKRWLKRIEKEESK